MLRRSLQIGFLLVACAAAAQAGNAWDVEVVSYGGPATIDAWTRISVPLVVENRGTKTWQPPGFNVSYHWRDARGAVVLWDGLRTPLPRPVPPGERIELRAALEPPPRAGALQLEWDVVEEGVAWASQHDATPAHRFPLTVIARRPPWAFSRTSGETPRLFIAGRPRNVRVTLRNDGTGTWEADVPIRLSYHWRARDDARDVFDGTRTPLPLPVPPDGSVTVDAVVDGPPGAGFYRLEWDVVHEGVRWFSDGAPGQSPSAAVVVLPAWLPAPSAFVVAVLGVVLVAVVVRRRVGGGPLSASAGVADLVTLAVALTAKQTAALTEAAVSYTRDGVLLAIASVAAVTLLLALVPRRIRPWAALAVNAAVTLVIFGDVLHTRFFGDFLSAVRIRAVGQLPEISSSIDSLLRARDLWLFADLVPAFALAVLVRRLPATRARRATLAFAVAAVIAILPALVTVAHLRDERSGRFQQVFKNAYVVQELGVLSYHAFDVFAHVTGPGAHEVPEARIRELEAWLRAAAPRRAGSGPYFGAARGRNLVMIQVESMQNFVLGARVGGVEVTPNLNALLAGDALWFSGCTDQTAQGRTSDGELLSQTSLHPLREGSAAFRYGGNRYHAIGSILQSRGYATLSAVPYEASFWNRLVTLPGYGYATNLFVADFEPGPVVGWGLNDRDFLRQMVPRLAQQQRPFAAFLITLSNHHPFDAFPDALKELKLGKYEGTPLGNYLHTMHLFDRAVGEFLDGLRAAGLLDETVLAIWGDHAAGLEYTPALAQLAGRGVLEPDFYEVDEVPFIIRVPGTDLRGARDLRCGAVDFAPTLLALLGVDPATYAFVGRNLLGLPGDTPVVRSYGTWFGNGVLYCPGGSSFADGRCYDAASFEKLDVARCRAGSELAREQLEVSRDIIEHDLQLELTQRLRPAAR